MALLLSKSLASIVIALLKEHSTPPLSAALLSLASTVIIPPLEYSTPPFLVALLLYEPRKAITEFD